MLPGAGGELSLARSSYCGVALALSFMQNQNQASEARGAQLQVESVKSYILRRVLMSHCKASSHYRLVHVRCCTALYREYLNFVLHMRLNSRYATALQLALLPSD